ncbi:hypothetical protein FB451DRAFT_1420997 [Mycena latifolia]|nr:hypothetical protein FB451DRAFT_1420997 [Mycena latifolia]
MPPPEKTSKHSSDLEGIHSATHTGLLPPAYPDISSRYANVPHALNPSRDTPPAKKRMSFLAKVRSLFTMVRHTTDGGEDEFLDFLESQFPTWWSQMAVFAALVSGRPGAYQERTVQLNELIKD